MNKVKTVVLRTHIKTGKIALVSFDYAKEKLSNYWSAEAIEGMMIFGTKLSTPFATYEVVEIEKKLL